MVSVNLEKSAAKPMHQGKYPVIFLTFKDKDVKFDSWEATLDKIRGLSV